MPLMPRTLIPLLPLALIFAAPLAAQDTTTPAPVETQETQVDMAAIERAYQAGDFIFVRKGLEQLARDENNAVAHYRYGRVLLQGHGGPADRKQAIEWLKKAVALSNVDAHTLLARVYLAEGEFYDAEAAAILLANAAARDNVEAKYYLGLLYQKGLGVVLDDKQAFNWFLAAAEGGHTKAKYELSKAYSRGQGADEDVDAAMKWLLSAAEDGNADAQYYLANAYERGPEAYRDTSGALDWYRRAAEGNQPLAQRALGTIYLNGTNGVTPNGDEALRWLTAAAKAEDPGAMFNLGLGYVQGTVLPRDDQLAAYWFELGAVSGLGRASTALAALYESGRGVDQSLDQAIRFYRQGLAQGDRAAALRLADMAIDGSLKNVMSPHEVAPYVALKLNGDSKDDALAWLTRQADAGVRPAQEIIAAWFMDPGQDVPRGVAYLETAAIAGSVAAQAQLGTLYSTGDGVELDYVRAHTWLNIAAASGHAKAAETRNLINDLMTPEQIAEAQTAARTFFETASSRAPQTEQVVRSTAGTLATGQENK